MKIKKILLISLIATVVYLLILTLAEIVGKVGTEKTLFLQTVAAKEVISRWWDVLFVFFFTLIGIAFFYFLMWLGKKVKLIRTFIWKGKKELCSSNLEELVILVIVVCSLIGIVYGFICAIACLLLSGLAIVVLSSLIAFIRLFKKRNRQQSQTF